MAGEIDGLSAINWCLENVGNDAWSWGWKVTDDKVILTIMVFTFARSDDAVLFRLTWT